MTPNHAHDCAFAVSFGDEPCDCDGPADEQRAPLDVAREHLARAREALGRTVRR